MNYIKLLLATLTLGTSFFLMAKSASAQAAYGSYIGVGASYGATENNNDEGEQVGGFIGARYKFLKAPISLRVQSLIGQGTAIVPTVSYDFPLNWQTDAYVGAGVSLPIGESLSPIGDETSFAIQPGVDFMIPNSNTVLFGNAIVAFDGYKEGNNAAFSLQGGLGLQF
jgi:hypothetical protein